MGVGVWFDNCLGSTDIDEQFLLSMFPSILNFNLESFSAVWGHNGLILGFKRGSDIVLGFTHIAEQCLFSILLSYPILNQPEFGGPIGALVRFKHCFGVYSYS